MSGFLIGATELFNSKSRKFFRGTRSQYVRQNMKTFLKVSIIATCSIFSLAGCMSAPNSNSALVHADGPTATQKNQASAPKKTMRAFRSEAELASYFREIAEKQRRETRGSFGVPESQPAPTASAALKSADSAGPASDKAASESVTNVQHAGVDEGGIVKVHGNHLVVLRRGRLFTVAIGDGALTPVSSVDAFAPDINPAGTWYDEMLVSDDTVAVIGYSYQRGGTEVGLFGINGAGKLSYRSTYHLRSND